MVFSLNYSRTFVSLQWFRNFLNSGIISVSYNSGLSSLKMAYFHFTRKMIWKSCEIIVGLFLTAQVDKKSSGKRTNFASFCLLPLLLISVCAFFLSNHSFRASLIEQKSALWFDVIFLLAPETWSKYYIMRGTSHWESQWSACNEKILNFVRLFKSGMYFFVVLWPWFRS